jgi:hypothetical protein
MKPKPVGFDFAEVDARKILKPYSHDKYIHDPEFDTVVYICRFHLNLRTDKAHMFNIQKSWGGAGWREKLLDR